MILVATLVLAAVFAVAGVAKLRDRPATRRAARELGVPEVAAGAVAAVLPVAELAVAAGLLVGPMSRIAAAAAAALLVAFTAAVALALARGRRPGCGCFGSSASGPIGPATLVRNAALVGLAAPRLPDGWHATLLTAGALALAGQSVLLALVLRRYGHALQRLDAVDTGGEPAPPTAGAELEVGAPAPPFSLETTDGRRVTLGELLEPGRPVLLAFMSGGCGACTTLLPRLARSQQLHGERLTVAVVAHGDERVLRAEAAEHGVENALVAPDRRVFDAYGVILTPSAVLVDPESRIATPMLLGPEVAAFLDPEPVALEVAHA